MAEVKINGVWKDFDGLDVVKDVNIAIPDKEFFMLVGPSGCGKSTMLRMIAGLEEISKGSISIAGRVVNNLPPKDRDIAMVFQNYALYPHMTVYENMAFGLKLKKVPKDEIERRVREAAEILNMGHLLERRPKALSGGQRQRVAVGRCIVRKPHVFLFDEPLSNLDAKLRVQMRVELNKLHDRLQTTIIYVTHDQVEAMTMGDRICVMREGRIQQVAPPMEIYERPANQFVAGFIGNPPMNFATVSVEANGSGLVLRHPSFSFILPPSLSAQVKSHVGREVVLGVRPEDIFDKLFYNYEVKKGSSVKAQVDVVEPMGSEIFLYCRAGKADFIVRVPPYVKTRAHQEMELVFNLEKAHLFDKETGEALIRDRQPSGPPLPAPAR
ncbi:MAG: ABC transporter ATP-binding protein [Elusimicrobiota bacterium]